MKNCHYNMRLKKIISTLENRFDNDAEYTFKFAETLVTVGPQYHWLII